MKKIIYSILVTLGIATASLAHAQVTNQSWKILSNILSPVLNSWNIQVPALGSSGNPCVTVSTVGVFSTTTCGSGSPAGSNTNVQFNSNGSFGGNSYLSTDGAGDLDFGQGGEINYDPNFMGDGLEFLSGSQITALMASGTMTINNLTLSSPLTYQYGGTGAMTIGASSTVALSNGTKLVYVATSSLGISSTPLNTNPLSGTYITASSTSATSTFAYPISVASTTSAAASYFGAINVGNYSGGDLNAYHETVGTINASTLAVSSILNTTGSIFTDSTGSSGSNGYVLSQTGSGSSKWVATSSLGLLSTSSITSFGTGWLGNYGGAIISSTSPSIGYLNATSTTASSFINASTTSFTTANLFDSGISNTQIPYQTSTGKLAGSANLVWDNADGWLGIGGFGEYAPITVYEPSSPSTIRLQRGGTSENYVGADGTWAGFSANNGSEFTIVVGEDNGGNPFQNDGIHALNILTSGNVGFVGIGTTTPGFPFTVAGNSFFGGNLTATGTLSITGTGTSTFSNGLTAGAINLPCGSTFASSTLFLDSSCNINATVLPVQGTASSLSSVVVATGSPAYETDTKFYKIGDGHTTIGNLTPVNMILGSSKGYYLASTTGSLGIGTTSPSKLLTVGNNNQFTVDSSGNVSAAGIVTINTLNGNTLNASSQVVTPVIFNGDDVSIGDPEGIDNGTTLDINGDTNTINFDLLGVDSIIKDSFNTYDNGAGKMGIGTSTPIAKIDSYTTASTSNMLLEEASGKGGCLVIKDVGAAGGYTEIYTLAGAILSKVDTSPGTCN